MKNDYTYKTVVCYAKIALYSLAVLGIGLAVAFYSLSELVRGVLF